VLQQPALRRVEGCQQEQRGAVIVDLQPVVKSSVCHRYFFNLEIRALWPRNPRKNTERNNTHWQLFPFVAKMFAVGAAFSRDSRLQGACAHWGIYALQGACAHWGAPAKRYQKLTSGKSHKLPV
jgi:hypothetical protein